jgi:hypothetical protein
MGDGRGHIYFFRDGLVLICHSCAHSRALYLHEGKALIYSPNTKLESNYIELANIIYRCIYIINRAKKSIVILYIILLVLIFLQKQKVNSLLKLHLQQL